MIIHTHTIIVIDLGTEMVRFIEHDSFAIDYAAHEGEGLIVGVCVVGYEGRTIQDMLSYHYNPPTEIDEDDEEPFYTLGEPRINWQ